MRVLLDTNVLARAASGPPGMANELVLEATRPAHALLLSPFVVQELSRVLRYDRLRPIHGLDEAGMDQYVADLVRACEMVFPIGSSEVVADDPDDDPIVAAALAGNADVLCTRDRHLLRESVVAYCQQEGVTILNDAATLAVLRQTP